MPPKKPTKSVFTTTQKQSKASYAQSSAQTISSAQSLAQSPIPNLAQSSASRPSSSQIIPTPPKLTWYEIVTNEEKQERALTKSPIPSSEDLANMARSNPALLGLEVFQNAVADFEKLQLAQNQSSALEISDPMTLQKIVSKKPATQYFEKSKMQPILVVEDEYLQKTPKQTAERIFPPMWHFQPKDFRKNQKFYEFILVDTDSIGVKHYKDKTNPSLTTHSTAQILRVLSPADWGDNPSNPKRFSQAFDPPYFNYWDYQQAWYLSFLYQNQISKHSWLIYFKNNVPFHFPYWFADWWEFYGPTLEILPDEVLEGFNTYQKKINLPLRSQKFPLLLNFYSQFALSWIVYWDYTFIQNTNQPFVLGRKFHIKWWQEFNPEKACKPNVLNWFTRNPRLSLQAEPSTTKFLQHKSIASTKLSAAKSKLEYRRLLLETLSELESEGQEDEDLLSIPDETPSIKEEEEQEPDFPPLQ